MAMDKMMSMQVLAGVCGLVLLILLLKKKAGVLLGFLVRAGVGAAMILVINNVLIGQGIAVSVGLNFFSLLTSASLGIPGVALLFAVTALQIL